MKSFFLLFFCSPLIVGAQTPAFPGAEGFGRYTTGGRGGAVYMVDNLSDDLKNPAEGSMRWAVEKEGPRTIVFQVSGTIALAGPLKIAGNNITIAGQTAPGDGICLRNYVLNIQADNVIIRYIRCRCGDEALMSDAQDAMNAVRHKNIIIDHCSLSWSIDEAGSFYDNENFTLQWCILSESLYNSGHYKGAHGFGGIWGGKGATFHHNLLAHHTSRNPRFNGSRYSTTSENEVVDFRNNVIFNWGFNSGYGGERGNQNMVNNYYKAGPGTRKGEVSCRIFDLTQQFYDPKINPDTLYAGRFFIDGNVVEGNADATSDNWKYGVQRATDDQKTRSRMEKLFPAAPVITHSAEQVFRLVLENAGAMLPERDTIDRRIVEEVKSGICKYGDSWGINSGIIDSQKSVGGWPELKSKPALPDSDRDGMPDSWEQKHNLNPNDAEDRNLDQDNDGYTNLEEYLNELVEL